MYFQNKNIFYLSIVFLFSFSRRNSPGFTMHVPQIYGNQSRVKANIPILYLPHLSSLIELCHHPSISPASCITLSHPSPRPLHLHQPPTFAFFPSCILAMRVDGCALPRTAGQDTNDLLLACGNKLFPRVKITPRCDLFDALRYDLR